jgi:broad specificity phosphatase PhoE
MQVWIVQHGEKIAASGDPGLTEHGHAQAALVARTLAGSGASVISSSPLRRARETAAHIEEALGLRAHIDARLRERMNWDGQQSIEAFMGDWARATEDRTFRPPTGDSSEDAGIRFHAAIEDLRGQCPDNAIAVVVSHGGVTVDGLRTMFGDDTVRQRDPRAERDGISPGAITRLHTDGHRWSLEGLGDTAHLAALGRAS